MEFTEPIAEVSGQINWTYFPGDKQSYAPGEEIKIDVQSSNQLLDPSRSHLMFKVRFTGASHANHRLLKVGLGACLKTFKLQIGGVEVENNTAYGKMLIPFNSNQLPAYQNVLKQLECYNDVQNACVTGNKFATGKNVCHVLKSSLLEQKRDLIPLPVSGAMHMFLTVENLNEILAHNNDGAITDVEISEVRYRACLIKPSEKYLAGLANAAATGTLSIPYEGLKVVTNFPKNISSDDETIYTGNLRSLKNIVQIIQSNAPYATTATTGSTTDFSDSLTMNGIDSYYLNIGSTRIPSNFGIKADGEHLQMLLNDTDNSNPLVNYSSSVNCLMFPLSSSSRKGLDSGYVVADQHVQIHKDYVSLPTNTAVKQYNFIFHDSVLRIGNNTVNIDYVQ